MRRTFLLLACALSACGTTAAPTQATTPRAPFACHGRSGFEPATSEVLPVHPSASAPSVEVLTPRTAPARMRVRADDTSVGRLMIALAEAHGVSLRVDPRIAAAPIGYLATDVSFDEAARAIGLASDAQLVRRGDDLSFEPRARTNELRRRRMASMESGSLETRLVPTEPLDPREVGQLFCASGASARGGAAVVGNRLLVWDQAPALDALEVTLRELGAEGSAPPGSSGQESARRAVRSPR